MQTESSPDAEYQGTDKNPTEPIVQNNRFELLEKNETHGAAEKKKTPEIAPIESSNKTGSPDRNQEDVELENEVNAELQDIQTGGSSMANKLATEALSSSDESDFVDATQKHDEEEYDDNLVELNVEKITTPQKHGEEEYDDNLAELNIPEAISKDVKVLKEAWANMEELDEVQQRISPVRDGSSKSPRSAANLSHVQQASQEADSVNPSSEDQDFQLVSRKNKKKADKGTKQETYSTRSKVGPSKQPFK